MAPGKETVHQMLAITLKEIRVLWRDRESLALLFAMPLFFILVMSFALEAAFEAGTKARPLKLIVVNHDSGVLARDAIADLKGLEGIQVMEEEREGQITLQKAEGWIREGAYPLALVFRENYSRSLLSGMVGPPGTAPVSLMVDPVMNRQLAASVQGAVRSVLERRALLARAPEGMDRMFITTLETTSPSGMERERRPGVIEQNVPAYTIFGVFFIALTLSSSLLQEKKQGTFQRILAGPVSRSTLLLGKLFPYYLVNLVQIALMFGVGVTLFGMESGNLPALVLVSLALSAAANGLGLLVAGLGRTEAQVNGLSVLLAITLGALGGMMVPAFLMPGIMKEISLFTPHAWALAAYHDIMIRGRGIEAILPEVGVLLCFAGGFFLLSLWRFRLT
jgi:ABC-2 type transport system permease protein